VTRGRLPKPSHLKLLQGKPGHRPLNENEPQPEVLDETPAPPEHLSVLARAEWERVYPMLVRNRLVTEADLSALSAYCQAYGRWQEAESEIAKQGLVFIVPGSGYPIQNPYLAIANKALEQMRQFLTEFGMTPSSRSRVSKSGTGTGATKKNKFAQLASGTKSKKRSA
jgi:P27 family predicted phage terminase small subunit